MKNNQTFEQQDQLDSEAEAWLLSLVDAPEDKNLQAKLHAWLALSPQHQAAYDKAAKLWLDLGVVQHFQPDVHKSFEQKKPVKKFRWGLAGGFVSAVLAFGVYASLPVQDPIAYQVVSTGIGELKEIKLSDGSVIELNANSELHYLLGDDVRRVKLVSGEAYFDVARDEQRPFVVTFRGGQAKVLGTEFNIDLGAATAEVQVTEGAVQLSEQDLSHQLGKQTVAKAGQQAEFGTNGLSKLQPLDIAQLAWTKGQLIFERDRLSKVVAQLSDYLNYSITLDDSIKDIPVTGVFSSDRPLEALNSIASALGLTLAVSDRDIKLSR